MRNIDIDVHAELEIAAAVDYYESRRPEWGRQFLQRFRQGLHSIQQMPGSFRIFDGVYHCYSMIQFPFGIVYSFNDEIIEIIAVIDQRRGPQFWKDRLGTW